MDAKNMSTVSEEDEEILLKRMELTEEAHKKERERSNLMDDVSCAYTVLYVCYNKILCTGDAETVCRT